MSVILCSTVFRGAEYYWRIRGRYAPSSLANTRVFSGIRTMRLEQIRSYRHGVTVKVMLVDGHDSSGKTVREMLLVWGSYQGRKVLCAAMMSSYCCINIVRETEGQLVLTPIATYTLRHEQLEELFAGRPVPCKIFEYEFVIEPVAEGFDPHAWLAAEEAERKAAWMGRKASMHSANL